MKEKLRVLLNKFAVIERELANEKGELTFFALLQQWGAIDSWDITVAASWADRDEEFNAIEYIVEKYYAVCDDSERVMIAGVTIINTDDDELDDILDDFDVEHGMVKMKYSRYFDKEFDRGYIFTCKRRTAERSLSEREHATGQPS